MKMIWPGRALGVALLVPALLSLVLFVSDDGLAVDTGDRCGASRIVALIDLATLAGAGRLRVERQVGRVCSLNERQDVELLIENPGGATAVAATARRRTRRVLGGADGI